MARLRPKPEEQPVMNHTGDAGNEDMVANGKSNPLVKF
jgi:hypothetical protein